MRPNAIITATTLAPVVVLGVAAASVPVQLDSPLSLVVRQAAPNCVIQCIGTSATVTDCSTADSQCMCMSERFVTAVAQCFSSRCSPQEQAAGIQFGEQLCEVSGHPVTIPAGIAASVASLTESFQPQETARAEVTSPPASSGGAPSSATDARTALGSP
ncbi:hypothetical protein OIV83_001416 [Microbotryomycetes sp. JL201]|nr:hypothetical protein OIV83_001416 [Microbotryomycetes sp. JL201]